MNIITNNPYRILGLSVTATDREIAKRVSNLSVYVEMGKEKTYDYDFINLAPIVRNTDTIKEAGRKLEQPCDKLTHSIFWLSYDGEESYLQQINNDNFAETLMNYPNSSVHNLQNKAVLTLLSDTNSKLKYGIEYYDKFMNHPDINKHIRSVVGGKFKHNFDLYDLFISQILSSLTKKSNSKELLNLFECTSKAEYVKEKIVEPIVRNIESKIENAKSNSNSNPTNAYIIGKELIDNTSEELSNLKIILANNDIIFTSISNQLAEQILDCSISYYNDGQSGKRRIFKEFLSPEETYELASKAKNIAKNGVILKRIEENIKTLQEIRYQDCYEAINFLNMIIIAYEKLNRENEKAYSYEKKTLNEILIIKDLKKIVTHKIAIKIAKSKNKKLISNFNYKINGVIKGMLLSTDAEEIKSRFVNNLPDTNRIKMEYNLNLLKNLISQKENGIRKVHNNKPFFSEELFVMKRELKEIEHWKLFRTKKTKQIQINKKNEDMNKLKAKSNELKKEEIARIENEIKQHKKQLEILKKEVLNNHKSSNRSKINANDS
jgi:hypothetical protein